MKQNDTTTLPAELLHGSERTGHLGHCRCAVSLSIMPAISLNFPPPLLPRKSLSLNLYASLTVECLTALLSQQLLDRFSSPPSLPLTIEGFSSALDSAFS